MILDLLPGGWHLVAVDLADPLDLSGGTHDYAYLGKEDQLATPDIGRCLRARIADGYKDQRAITWLSYDTETAEATVWLGGDS